MEEMAGGNMNDCSSDVGGTLHLSTLQSFVLCGRLVRVVWECRKNDSYRSKAKCVINKKVKYEYKGTMIYPLPYFCSISFCLLGATIYLWESYK